jgi:hypothetical protein
MYTLANFAGAAQNYDGNGPYVRAQIGGGSLLVGEPNPEGNPSTFSDQINYAHTAVAPIGNQPQLGGMPPLKPDVPCYTNPVPDVNGPLGQVGAPTPAPVTP